MSYTYRERDRTRDWDDPPRSSVSIRRYVIPADDERERERDVVFRRENPSTGNRELVIRRTVEREEQPVTVQRYDRDRDVRSERDYYAREYSQSSGQRRDVASSGEAYLPPPLPPAPIIIREQPIIIQEARGPVYVNQRDSDFEIVQRSEVIDRDPRDGAYIYDRRVREYEDDRRIRREISPGDSVSQASRRHRGDRDRDRDRDRDYSSDDSVVYIRKETREYDGSPPHHLRHLAEGALVGVGAAEILRDHHRREGEEVSHGLGRVGRDVGAGVLGAVAVDAARRARNHFRSRSRRRSISVDEEYSSRGRGRRHRHRHRSRSSSGSRSRSRSHPRAKTLAEIGLGAAALVSAAALARNANSNNNNRDPDGGRRSRSRRRRASSVGDPAAAGTARSVSRRRKNMAAAGLAGAAVAGLVEKVHNRSRSRKGKRSPSAVRKALPVVIAGLGSAAAAGLYEKNKMKRQDARGGGDGRNRSSSRGPNDPGPGPGTYADPAAAADPAGLIEYGDRPVYGSIPAADYYGRPMTPNAYYSDGAVPMASGAVAGYEAGRHPRSRSRSRSRSRNRGDRYSSSPSDSDRESRRQRRSHRRKNRSRSRELAEGVLAGAGLTYAAQKLSQRSRERKKEKERRHRDNGDHHDPYEEGYDPEPYPASPIPGGPEGQQPPAPPPPGADHHPYPSPGYFPPPPNAQSGYPPPPTPYNPADYPPPPGAAPPAQPYGYPPPPQGPAAGTTEPYAPRPRRADENVSAAPSSALPKQMHDGITQSSRGQSLRGGHRTRRSQSSASEPQSKSVAFDLDQNEEVVPNGESRGVDPGYDTDDSDLTIDGRKNRRRRRHQPHRRHGHDHGRHGRQRSSSVPHVLPGQDQGSLSSHSAWRGNPPIPQEQRLQPPPPSSEKKGKANGRGKGHGHGYDSDSTIDLPPRFDAQGRRLPGGDGNDGGGDDSPLTTHVEELLRRFF